MSSRRLTDVEVDAVRDGMDIGPLVCDENPSRACGSPRDWKDGTDGAGHELRIPIDTAHVSAVARMMGSRGGKSTTSRMTREQLSARGKAAAKARWRKP